MRKVTPSELGIPEAAPLPSRTDWRIGLVGFGGIAPAHAAAYLSAGWRIVAVADPDPAARERAKEVTGAEKLYEDFGELVGDDAVEIVSLLTQPALREPVVRAAAGAGKPIQTEKPLGTTLAECERMVECAERAGIPFAVNQNFRWAGANFFAHHIIVKGLVGEPYYASIEVQGTQDVDVRDHPFYPKCEDFLTIQWNNHLSDLLRYWLGADAVRVTACTRRMRGQNFASDNLLISTADFGEGITGHIVHSELLRSSLRKGSCRVDGDAGSVEFDLSGARLVLHSKELGDEPREFDAEAKGWADSMRGPMGDLLLSIEEAREPLVSARRNLATMRHILAEDRSAREGGVWVDPAGV